MRIYAIIIILFQSPERIYLVTPFMKGGDLYHKLKTDGYLTEDVVRFYTAQIAIALQHLHEFGIAYRDLKPENILIGVDGHIKLTDFGLSKILPNYDKTYTICGTVQYLAPEILGEEGYNTAVDWWSLGCIFYEMLVGKFPFRFQKDGKLNSEVYKKPIRYPSYLDIKAKDLISKLLENDPTKRLGSGENGWEKVKEHPYFSDVDWNEAKNKN